MTNDMPPYNVEVERSVLGACLYSPDVIDAVSLIVRPDDFFRDVHQRICRLLFVWRRENSPIDYIALHDAIERGACGPGVDPFIGRELMDSVPSVANAEHHAATVAGLAKKRRHLDAALRYVEDLKRCEDFGDEVAAQMERTISSIRCDGIRLQSQTIGEVAAEALESIRAAAVGTISGLPTPWEEFNRMTGGLEAGRLYVFAGRPGSGKSSIALNVATHAAEAAQVGCYFVSLEMSSTELGVRSLSAETGISGSQLTKNPEDIVDGQWESLAQAVEKFTGLNVHIDITADKTIEQIVDEARVYVRQRGVGLIVVDHIGIINPTRDQRRLSRQQQIGVFTRALKLMAKDLGVPVVALSQLNRDLERREDKRPHLADLRESGDIEQDADVVAMVFRPSQLDDEADPSDAELIVRKNRAGQCGTVNLTFDAETTTFRKRERGTSPKGKPKRGDVEEAKSWLHSYLYHLGPALEAEVKAAAAKSGIHDQDIWDAFQYFRAKFNVRPKPSPTLGENGQKLWVWPKLPPPDDVVSTGVSL